jgi:hypothetical protein
MLGEESGQRLTIPKVSLHEGHRHGLSMPIREIIEDHDLDVSLLEGPHAVAADVAGTSDDDDRSFRMLHLSASSVRVRSIQKSTRGETVVP